MRKSQQKKFPHWRFWVVALLLASGMGGLVIRLVDLTVHQRSFLLGQGNSRSLRVVSVPAYRGMITTRAGDPLAVSTPVDAVWVDPKTIQIDNANLPILASLLGINFTAMRERIQHYHRYEFLYLKRQVNPNLAEKVKELAIPGVFLKTEYQRFYPDAAVSSQLVGFTNIDDKGQEGLELAYNKWLAGSPGKKSVLIDRLGQIVRNIGILKEARPGNNLVLSIDRRIQYLAYRTLKKAIKQYQVSSGSIVVLDVKTGEVLAMANLPSFNPNNRSGSKQAQYRNRAVTDMFEPGSTIKSFAIANALGSGKYTSDTLINTAPGWLRVGRHEVRDDRDNQTITVTQILQRSSNVGVTKLTLSLPPASLPNLLRRFGFGQKTSSHFPGETAGYLPKQSLLTPFVLATLSFGYGMAVTNLQLASSYAALANGGLKCPISLLRLTKKPVCPRVLSEKTSQNIVQMLESVVERGGTATEAQVPGYRVAGKTGTVRIVGKDGYEKNHHDAMFVGMAPLADPRLVISVILRDPKGKAYYGGLLAAPVFSEVMSGSLRLLDISPDALPPGQKISKKMVV